MATEMLLVVEPQQFKFPYMLNEQVSCSIRLSNRTQLHVAFKVMTTSPERYSVLPKSGTILPGSSCNILVTKAPLLAVQPGDKFLIKSVIASSYITDENIIQDLVTGKAGYLVQNSIHEVIYTSPSQIPPPVADILSSSDASRAMSTTKLLDIHPTELEFPFELNKELSCQLQLSNMTKNHAIFKVKTTDPKKYAVRPNYGVVMPQSTCDVIVMMRAQTEIPLDRLCKDKFLIQSVVGSSAATTEQITSEMFNETGRFVDELKLRAVYSFPSDSQSSKHAESEVDSVPEAPSLRVRSLNDPQVVQGLDRKECTFWDFFWNTVIVGILCFMFWHLMVKTLPFVWSLTFGVIMLVGKVVRSLVTNSVDDWIVNTLGYVFVHFITVLFRRLANRSET